MVRGSYVFKREHPFCWINSCENEESKMAPVMKDVTDKERLTCPHLGTLSTERLTCPLPRNTEHVRYEVPIFLFFSDHNVGGFGFWFVMPPHR